MMAEPERQPLPLSTMVWSATTLANPFFHQDAVTYNDNIYLIGGLQAGLSQGLFRRTNGNTVLQTIDNMTVPRSAHTSVVVGTKVYVFGGNNGNASGFSNQVSVYDFSVGGGWVNEPQEMPTFHSMGDGVAIGTDIYLIGGSVLFSEAETPAKFNAWKYNTVNKTWTELTGFGSIPGQLDVGITAIGREIYILGGRRANAYNANFWKYNIDTSTVTPLANRPLAYGCRRGVFNVDGRVVSLMGLTSNAGIGHGRMFWYTPSDNTWHEGAESSAPRGVAATARLGDEFFVSGGYHNGVISTTQKFAKP